VALKGLQDRVVLVTGGASGIGRATVDRLVDEGARVACVDVDVAGIERAVGELGEERVFGVTADVSREEEVVAAFAAVRDHFGRVDAVHNNAGIEGSPTPLVDASITEFDRVVSVNLRGAFLVLREMLRTAADQGGPAAIVNTASGTGVHAVAGLAAYSATKAGVISLTRVAAVEAAAAGVRVNAVVPGPIDTPLLGNLAEEVRAGAVAGLPIGRIGMPEEVAAVVVWLLSDESPFVTGAFFAVDGGETA
jgi:NAD(P)-dependent dehydrogenase (short-subunit alcohol dehydrogenase family)